MKDQASILNPRVGFIPATNNASDTAIVSAIIDRQGFESLTFLLNSGTLSDADVTTVVLVEDGDDSGLSDNAAVADAELSGTELLAAFAFGDDSKCKKIGYLGNKRYVRLTLTPTSNAGAMPLACIALLGNGHIGQQPTTPV
jgi:hypothetical protein